MGALGRPSAVGLVALALAACGGGGPLRWVAAQPPEDPVPDDPMDDDERTAVLRLREQLQDQNVTGGKFGVVMVAGPADSKQSPLTIPIWREYCKRRKIAFFLQREPLNVGLGFEWTKPRLLIELVPAVKWRYALVVDPNTLPVDFNRSYEFLIKLHMRHKRYFNDEPSKRVIFCPENCVEEYKNAVDDGACGGPLLSGCIFQASKSLATKLVRHWYAKRKDESLPSGDRRIFKALEKVHERYYDEIFFRDIQADVGKEKSKFIKAFGWSEENGFDLRTRIHDFIAKHKTLSKVGNQADKAEELSKVGHHFERAEEL